MKRRILIVAVVASSFAPLACAPKSESTIKKQSTAGKKQSSDGTGASTSYDPSQLERLVESFSQKARALPGRTDAEHRDAMRGVFDDLSQLLPIFEGPEQSGAFRQQLRTIESARDRLGADVKSPSSEPAIDTGLRACEAALQRLGSDQDFADATTKDLLGKIGAKVNELDEVRTVGRPYVAADAVQSMAELVRHMADKLGSGSNNVATAAATEPSEKPTTSEPAATTEPATTEPAPSATAEPAPAAPDVTPAPAKEPAPPEAKPEDGKPADAKPAEDANK
jgi:hypothetical protein